MVGRICFLFLLVGSGTGFSVTDRDRTSAIDDLRENVTALWQEMQELKDALQQHIQKDEPGIWYVDRRQYDRHHGHDHDHYHDHDHDHHHEGHDHHHKDDNHTDEHQLSDSDKPQGTDLNSVNLTSKVFVPSEHHSHHRDHHHHHHDYHDYHDHDHHDGDHDHHHHDGDHDHDDHDHHHHHDHDDHDHHHHHDHDDHDHHHHHHDHDDDSPDDSKDHDQEEGSSEEDDDHDKKFYKMPMCKNCTMPMCKNCTMPMCKNCKMMKETKDSSSDRHDHHHHHRQHFDHGHHHRQQFDYGHHHRQQFDYGHHHHHDHSDHGDGHDHDHHHQHRHQPDSHSQMYEAHCHLSPNVEDPESDVSGHVTIMHRKDGKGPLYFDISLEGFKVPKGSSGAIHGFHIHENPVVDHKCSTAGPHFNPTGSTHGAPDSPIRHVGDLGNIKVNAEGKLEKYIMQDDIVKFIGENSIIGRSIVVHELEDDLGQGGDEGSLTTGNAGGRLSCCTIEGKVLPSPIAAKPTLIRFNG